VIDEVLEQIETRIGALHDKMSGVVVGTVTSVMDPLMLGRVQVAIPALDSSDPAPWARVATPMAGSSMGFYFIPRKDDEVLVAFEHGSPAAPYVIGCLWNASNPPPEQSPLTEIRKIKTPKGIEITLSDLSPTVTITTPSKQKVEVGPSGITIDSGTSTVEMAAAKPSVTITAGGNSVELAPAGITIKAATSLKLQSDGTIDIQAKATCTIKGSLVQIN
jgi:phage baseplate assembly protein gpV